MSNKKYPIGIQDFKKIIEDGYLYVDKTSLIYEMINENSYYFISRPRRFGKSLLTNTIKELFLGNKSLFKGLSIEDKWDWTIKRPVIRLSFANLGVKELGFELALINELNKISKSIGISLTSSSPGLMLKELLEKINERDGRAVLLIDEYDHPIVGYLGEDEKLAIINRDKMKSFFSVIKDADNCIEFFLVTGITKFSKISIFSDLNNLRDITTSKKYSSLCGISENELEHYFKNEISNSNRLEIKEWYNGYTWDGDTKIYNPHSLLNYFAENRFINYWFETGTPSYLVKLNNKRDLYDFENVESSLQQINSFDLEDLDIIAVMFQSGYLTFKEVDFERGYCRLGYPNKEVKQSYLEVLSDSLMESKKSLISATGIEKSMRNEDFAKLREVINSLIQSIPSNLWLSDKESFYHSIIHLIFKLACVNLQSEISSSEGKLDIIVYYVDKIYCFEFKVDQPADKAIQQIREKNYLDQYRNSNKKLIAVGVEISKKKRGLEDIKWEILD